MLTWWCKIIASCGAAIRRRKRLLSRLWMAWPGWGSSMTTHWPVQCGSFRAGCFFEPELVEQGATVPSSLQLLSGRGGQAGYNEALATRKKFSDTKCRTLARQRMSKKSSQALGPHGRGSQPIKAKSLQKLRKEVGTVGGQRGCGNGSTEQVVERTARWTQRWKDENCNWPSRRLAAKKWRVSGDL